MTELLGDYRWVLDQLPAAIWVGNVPDGTVAYANHAFEVVLGMSASSSSRVVDISQTYGVVDRDGKPYPTDKLPFSRVLATGAPAVVDDMVIRRPNADTNIRAFASPVFRADRTMSHVIVVFYDVTHEMNVQREREEVEARLRFVCNNAPISMWTTDIEGNITLSEGAALASLGVKPGQLVGQNVFDLYRGHPTVPGYMRQALAGESFWYTAADGDVIFESWLSPLYDRHGKLIGLAGFSNDVSEIRKLQNTVIQNDRAKAIGTLAASVAHEINNPLTYMLAHGDALNAELDVLEGLLAGVGAPQVLAMRESLAKIREDLAPVRTGTSQIANITRDLRTFSRADDVAVLPVDVRAAVHAVLKLVRKEVEARARLVLDLRETRPVMGNETRLVQVILNLVVNALQALPIERAGRHEVSVRTYSDGANVVIEVGDSGPGVPAAHRERIFDPFFSTKDIGAGTGLGLFVCRNIVRELSGDVSVTDGPEGGALFRVTLPAGLAQQSSAPAPERPSRSVIGRHVLVIDDDAMVRRALAAQLTHAGFRVTSVGDAESGLAALLGADDIDLVYCDLMMTGMTGMDFASALADRGPAKRDKVVFMTGGAFSPAAQDFVSRHRDRTVNKPFDIVAETIRRLTAN